MTGTQSIEQTVNTKKFTWARIVSDVFSPPVVWIALSLPVASIAQLPFEQTFFWAFIYSFFVCLLPIIYIFYLRYTGQIGDIHMKYRHERYRPLFFTMLSCVVGWVVLYLGNAPAPLQLLIIISLLQITIISVVTLYWQISMHAMAITSASIALGTMFSINLGFLSIPLIILVGSARFNLDRHTPMQVFMGAMVGVFVPVLLFTVGSSFLQWIL
jgi:hypothetical protein